MSPRPYFHESGEKLRSIFELHRSDLGVLTQLRAELERRTTPKMRALLVEVLREIADHATDALGTPASQRLTERTQGDLFEIDEEEGDFARGGNREGHGQSANAELPPDNRRLPAKYTLIQPPGVEGRPAKYIPPLSDNTILDFRADTSNARRFSMAIDSLVQEMKAKGTGSRSILLNDGVATEVGLEGFGYIFPFAEDGDLFEDARVLVLVGNQRCSGSIVSILPAKILLSLEVNLGPRVRTCVLRVDNTALLIALKDRLIEVDEKRLTLNTSLADAVISRGVPDISAPLIGADSLDPTLDPQQRKAVRQALQSSVFYLWGPPGTGKTRTLAILVGRLFSEGKRVLVCSNTNQAVDQLLVRLCEQLGREHPALRDGKVIRQGRITPERLGGFDEYLVLNKIVERVSRTIRERRVMLLARLGSVEADASRVEGMLRLFQEWDETREKIPSLESELRRHREAQDRFRTELSDAIKARAADEQTLEAWRQAGPLRRWLMPSESSLKQRVAISTQKAAWLESVSRISLADADRVVNDVKTLSSRALDLERALTGQDRATLVATKESLDKECATLRGELTEVQKQLDDIERSLLATARVIGTTVTRAYLSVKDYGAFDAVIIDEASMVMVPALYLAAGLARERVIISGDFNQLPPIIQSNQQGILDAIGMDVFSISGVTDACRAGREDPRVVMLDTQRRMAKPVCDLVTAAMPYPGLKTHSTVMRPRGASTPPEPFSGPLTVIDSSRIWPFENRNILSSRFNLMHTLLVRNLCWHLRKSGFLTDVKALGICTPYSAHAKLLNEILKGEGLGDLVTASTIHRFQGDEKRMMLLDIPESIGSGFNIGQFIQADDPDDAGSKLLNVAVSRAMDHMAILANLTYLDAKLPSNAKLRVYIHEMQTKGKVVDAQELLALRPITEDLRYRFDDGGAKWTPDASGLFRQDGFDREFQTDVARAKKGIAIFSGFVTPQRVSAYGDLFRTKVQQGVTVRCVTRPPQYNGSMSLQDSRRSLDALEAIGVIVDTRAVIHEKVVIIDDELVWFGSLNPLSHTSRTDELMVRVINPGWASQVASLLSILPGGSNGNTGNATRKENPTHGCGGRMCYFRGKWGPFFRCENCGKNQNLV